MNNKLQDACWSGNIEDAIIAINAGEMDFSGGLTNACTRGHAKLAKLMIEKGAKCNMNILLGQSCFNGYKDIVLLLVENGANDYNWGLCMACRGNNEEIVLIMIERGADDWNNAMRYACFSGYEDLVLLMIEKGADDWDGGLANATCGDFRDIMLLMIKKGASKFPRRISLSLEDILYLSKNEHIRSRWNKYINKCKNIYYKLGLNLSKHILQDLLTLIYRV